MRTWRPWFIALAALASATLLSLAVARYVAIVPTSLLFLGVVITAWYGNLAAALAVTIISALARQSMYVASSGTTWTRDDWGSVALFSAAAAIVSVLIHRSHGLQAHQQRIIADREKTARQLRASEERFRSVFNHQLQFNALLSPEGMVLDVNELPLRVGGVRREDVVGKFFWETPWWRDLPEMRASWPRRLAEAARADQPVFSEDKYQVASGEARTADASITPVKDAQGKLAFFIVQANDTTERRRADAALRRSERQYRLAKEAAGIGLWTLNVQSGDVEADERVHELFDLPAGQTRLEQFHSRIHDEDRPRLVRALENTARAGAIYREEFRVVSRSGKVRWLAGLASRFKLERGLSVVGLNLDITQRKENELALEMARAELQQHATRLEEIVAERTAKLEASVKSMEELLYTIAHDLRAPNRAVQGYSELLLEEYGAKLDHHATELLRRMKRAATRNDELIRDLLQLGRISNAEVPIEKVDPGRVLAESIQQLEREVDLRHAQIRLAPDWPVVLGNPALLKQVFTNLISNAIKYVPPGRDPELHISGTRENGRAILRFADNGVGIESDQQKRIFEAFIRLPGNREPAGTGIGLAIVRKAAERMNGRVGLDSTPGQGTCFWVELPAG